MNNGLKIIYSKGDKVVMVSKNRRKDIWEAELHLGKKMKMYEFKDLQDIKNKMKEEGYECIQMSFTGEKDFSKLNQNFYCTTKKDMV